MSTNTSGINPDSQVGRLSRTCTKCGETKSLQWFKKDSRLQSGYSNTCKACNSKHAQTLTKFVVGLLCHRDIGKTLSLEDVLSLWDKQRGLCALSGVPMTFVRGEGNIPTNISLDRIEAGGAYTKENVRLVCRVVNHMRWTSSDEELYWWCEQILRERNSV
jgi:ribosomal protein S14